MQKTTSALSCATALSTVTPDDNSAASHYTAFINARLIDGCGNPVLENASVIIHGERITAVGRRLPVPPGATVIDLQGKTLMPGLMDMHVHMGDSVINSAANKGKRTFGGAAFNHNYRYARETHLKYGVTTVRSLGDYLDDILQLRQAINDGTVSGPRLFVCGPSFQQPGGHPGATVWHADPQTLAQAARLPTSVAQANEMVDELAARGVDLIKVIISATKMDSAPDARLQLPWAIIQAIIERAHQHQLPVAAHTQNVADSLTAVELGANTIEHLHLFAGSAAVDQARARQLFQRMREKGAFLDATMIVGSFGFKPIASVNVEQLTFGNQLVHEAWQSGVRLTAGTDAGAPELVFGWALHAELYMMVHDQGIPPLEAIKAATLTSAELLGQQDALGSIAAGKLADLLIIDGRPDRDIRELARIDSVWMAGEPVFSGGELVNFRA